MIAAHRSWARWSFAIIGLFAFSPGSASAEPPPQRGQSLVERFECNRCHEGGGLEQPAPDKACVGCHAAIESGAFEAPKDVLERWQLNIVDLTAVPSLAAIGDRLRRGWVRDFLLHPHDLRPGLRATMPRLALSADEADAIATWLVPTDDAPPEDARWLAWPSRGRHIVETRGCMSCHTFSGVPPLAASPIPVPLGPDALAHGVMLAPDLRHVRERMKRQALVAWLRDPAAQKPGTAMPSLGLTRMEAEDVAAFLLEAPLAPLAPEAIPPRLPVLERRVPYAEVSARVFNHICWHCHSEPDLALGDGGPGNTGGFGFSGRGLNLRDYASIMAGSLDDAGQRKSIFRKVEGGPLDGVPRLLAHLLARRIEEAGGVVPGVRGMPLGLPSMTPEEIQLVESWIAQGRPE